MMVDSSGIRLWLFPNATEIENATKANCFSFQCLVIRGKWEDIYLINAKAGKLQATLTFCGKDKAKHKVNESFEESWLSACLQCKPELDFSAFIANLKFDIRSCCDWTVFFLKLLFKAHLSDIGIPIVHKHQLLIVEGEIPKAFKSKSWNKIWQGEVADGTPLTLSRYVQYYKMEIGEEFSAISEVDQHKTLCFITESRKNGSKRLRPQPGGYIYSLIQLILSMHKLYVMHAAAVADNGRSVLFLGKSGAGKTTISLLLSRRGLKFMGDDLVAVGKIGDEIRSYSLLFKPRVVDSPPRSYKKVIDSITEDSLSICSHAHITAVVYLNKSNDNVTRFIEQKKSTVLTWLLEQGNHCRFLTYPQDWFITASILAEQAIGCIWQVSSLDDVNTECITGLLS